MSTKRWIFIGSTSIAAGAALLIALNLKSGREAVSAHVEHRYAVDDPQFQRTMATLLGPPLIGGNRVETLVNGDRIFPAMLEAIRSARQTINFETFIYWSGDIGRQFANALSERSRNGVAVHVLLDWVGSQKMEETLLNEMRQSGVVVEQYHPVHWYTLHKMNNRTHRKLLVVDGRIGFTGGVGIADVWTGDAQDSVHWRDTHFRVEGPAVAQMQAAFLDNWIKVTGRVLHSERYFPLLEERGRHRAQMFHSSPGGGSESMHLMYLLSISAAKRDIHLSMAYFAPDRLALDAFVAALRRGVKVRILLPGPITDSDLVRYASRAEWGDLLRLGAEIHEFQPTMFHCKVLVIDGLWTSVGSTNFDNRSFKLNDEANLNVFDAEFAQRQIEIFENDIRRARRITVEEWENRPWTEKFRDWAVSLLNPQL
jgi:cardiolipin synthase